MRKLKKEKLAIIELIASIICSIVTSVTAIIVLFL